MIIRLPNTLLADVDRIRLVTQHAVQDYFRAQWDRAIEDRTRPRSYLGDSYIPEQDGEFHDRTPEVDWIRAALARPELVLLTLQGRRGIGKTAMVAKLRMVLAATTGVWVPLLYLSAYGDAPLTATMMLGALAGVADAPGGYERYARIVRDPSLTWVAKVQHLLDALAGARVLVVVDNAGALFDIIAQSPANYGEVDVLEPDKIDRRSGIGPEQGGRHSQQAQPQVGTGLQVSDLEIDRRVERFGCSRLPGLSSDLRVPPTFAG